MIMNQKNRIYISVPVNISRNLIMRVRELCPNSEVFSSSKKFYADDLTFLDKIKAGKIDEVPDLIVTIRPEILWNKDLLRNSGYFDASYRYGVGSFMESDGFLDDAWIFKPVFIMPLVLFYNKNVENPPESWESLMETRFKGKILCTDEKTPPASFFRQFYIKEFGEKGEEFVTSSVNYKGLPIDVNSAIGKGEYDIGIMPVTFARFSRNNNACFCWPKEGALPLMQVMLLKKDCNEESRKAAEFFVSEQVQKELSFNAGFIPVISGVNKPEVAVKNDMRLMWKGWDAYMAMAPQPD